MKAILVNHKNFQDHLEVVIFSRTVSEDTFFLEPFREDDNDARLAFLETPCSATYCARRRFATPSAWILAKISFASASIFSFASFSPVTFAAILFSTSFSTYLS